MKLMKNKTPQSNKIGSIYCPSIMNVLKWSNFRILLILSLVFLWAKTGNLSAAVKIFEHPQSQTVTAGNTVVLRVSAKASGSRSIGYQWWKDGLKLNRARSASIMLSNLQPSMEGLYSVVVTDEYRSITSKAARVSVARPFFLEDFEDGDAGDGSPVKWVANPNSTAGSTGAVIDGAYVLSTTGHGSAEVSEPGLIGDVSIRATLRGLSMSDDDGTIVVYARQQSDQLGGESYWGAVTPLGMHTGMNTGPSSRKILGTMVNPSLNPFSRDINVQFDVVGRKLTLRVWPRGSSKPNPQLVSTAPSSLPPGRVGFHTNAREVAFHSFDAIRIGNSLTPILRWENLGGDVLRFTVPIGFVLQSSPSATSPQWSVVEGTDSIDIDASGAFKIFRLLGQ